MLQHKSQECRATYLFRSTQRNISEVCERQREDGHLDISLRVANWASCWELGT